jgi:hypothetical protein
MHPLIDRRRLRRSSVDVFFGLSMAAGATFDAREADGKICPNEPVAAEFRRTLF